MEMFWALYVVHMVISGYAVRWIARRRGIHDSNMLFVWGIMFGWIAVVYFAFSPVSWFEGTEKVPPQGSEGSSETRLEHWRKTHPRK